ncbi:MAG: hypothetical protein ACYC10_21675, partial [Allorhizobium sp.]
MRSGGDPVAARCPTSGKTGSPSGVRQSETPPASFAFGKRANEYLAGRPFCFDDVEAGRPEGRALLR